MVFFQFFISEIMLYNILFSKNILMDDFETL